MKYGEKVKEAYNGYAAAYADYKKQVQQIEEDARKEKIGGAEKSRRLEALNSELQSKRASTLQQIGEAARQHGEAVAAWNDYKPEQISEDAKLLEMPLNMGAERLERLAQKYKDNPLMQQLILQKADKEDVQITTPGFWTAEQRVNAFKGYAESACAAVRNPESMQAGLFAADYGVPQSVNCDY